MSEGATFRILLALVFGGMLFLWARNLIRVRVTRDVVYAPAEGPLVAISIRLLLGLSVTGIVVFVARPEAMAWSAVALPDLLRWLGAGLGVGALVLIEWVFRFLGRGFSTSVTIREGQSLVTDGPYRWVRHPLYSSFVLLWLSFSLLAANWFIAVTGLGGYAIGMIVRTPREEAVLIEAFGQDYVDYRRTTGRYVPRIFGRRERTSH